MKAAFKMNVTIKTAKLFLQGEEEATAMPNANPDLNLLSVENGVYRYQIQFSESGQSSYTFRFYHYTCQFKAVVNE